MSKEVQEKEEINKKELRNIISGRLKVLRKCKHKVTQNLKLSGKKKRIHPAHKQVQGRILELQRLKRHLIYDDFKESYPYSLEVCEEKK